MKYPIIVLDANVYVKIFHKENDTQFAKELVKKCISENIRILVPEHFLYEVANACNRVGVKIEKILRLFESINDVTLFIIAPQISAWLLAEQITNSGNIKSGFSTMFDIIYHALAIESEGIFITADKKHFVKSEKFEHVCLLEEWEKIF